MPSDRDTLISMGFDAARVDWALKATQSRGLQPAMDHILEHEGQTVPDPSSQGQATSTSGPEAGSMDVDEDDEESAALQAAYGKAKIAPQFGGESGDQAAEAKSIKCSQCGKIFKNTALANFHAEKSGHDQFEESTDEVKPLTEEEKKQKLEELREKLAAKRATKSVEEAKENKANEAIRRKAGKDVGQLKEDMKAKEAIKAAEKARQDKIDDARARAAIKAQIEADKRERAEKAAKEKALREGKPLPASDAAPAAPAASGSSATSGGVAGKDYKETRLQIRMSSSAAGGPYTTTLSSDSTLREVAEYVAGQTLAVDVETVSFAMHFPRKQFSKADFAKTLRELGLTPSAVLIAS